MQKKNLRKRDLYLKQMIAFQDTEMIKVMTGIRRCGKSSLMKLMAEHLRESGVTEDQILDCLLYTSQLKKMEKFFSKIDVFSMATDNLIDRFKEIYGDKYNNKIRKVPFGLSNLYFLDNLDKNKDYKRIFGINKNRIVISIGHNTCVEQQHISVLKEIASLSAEMKNKIAIILQLTYGNGTENYIKNVEEEANKIGCPIVVLRKYMSGDEIASMVSATDIYINSQQSDAISGAMLEYLYGGAAVINPKWIDYTELKKAGCDFIQYDSFDDIPIIIEQIIAGQISCDFQENYLAVKKISHWDVNKNKWRALFEGGQ